MKPALPKPNVLPVWLLTQPVLMMLTTKNVNATPAPVILIPMHKLQPKVMLPTEAAKAVLKQNISARKTPAPVTQLANAAAKSALPSAIAALLKSLRAVRNAAMILALRALLQSLVVQALIKEVLGQRNVEILVMYVVLPLSLEVSFGLLAVKTMGTKVV